MKSTLRIILVGICSSIFMLLLLGVVAQGSFATATTMAAPTGKSSPVKGMENTKTCPMTIQLGSKGYDVEDLQQALNKEGYRDQDGKRLVTDGVFGQKTLFAVRNFQSRHAPPADGVVGHKTWRALGFC